MCAIVMLGEWDDVFFVWGCLEETQTFKTAIVEP